MDESYARLYPDLAANHFWWKARRQTVRALVQAGGPQPISILDVGCGSGDVLQALADLGHVEGVEVDPLARGKGHPAFPIHVCSLDEAPLERDEYDVVLLLDVLEHVTDRDALLGALRTRMSRQGRLIVTVPAHKWLWTSHDEMNQHQLRYARRALVAELEAAGFRVVDARYLFAWLVLPKLAVRLIETARRRPMYVARIPHKVINSILGALTRIEMRIALTYRLPFGTTIIAVAELSE